MTHVHLSISDVLGDLALARDVLPELSPAQRMLWKAELAEAECRLRQATAQLSAPERASIDYVLHKHLCSVVQLVEEAMHGVPRG